jgi:uncharacterized membrane protein YczE
MMSVFGVAVCGVSVGFFKRAAFGVDPFQSFMSGMEAVVPISFGGLYVMVNACLLLFALLLDRRRIGLATVINLFLLGYIADYSHRFLLWCIPQAGLPVRLLLLLIAIVTMCLSSSFYFTADLGVSTYDAVALILADKCPALPFRFWRVATDLACVAAGVLLFRLSGQPLSGLTQMVGLGTLITAFFMGPLIEFFNVHIAQPFLQRGN